MSGSSVFSRDGSEDDSRQQRSAGFEQRIDQRRAKVRRYLLVEYFPLIGKLHFRGARRVLFWL